jgi:trimethylamine:corrinoid methyltransferase-like protein
MPHREAQPSFRLLQPEQCEVIHRASLEILRRTGVRVYHDEATDHPFLHFRKLWRPQLFSRLGGEEWALAGGRRTHTVLRDRTISIIEEHNPARLPDGVEAEIRHILEDV